MDQVEVKQELNTSPEAVVKPLGLEEEIPSEQKKKLDWRIIAGGVLIVVFGVFSGWGLTKVTKDGPEGLSPGSGEAKTISGSEKIKVGQTYGVEDNVFSDNAVGVIEADGTDGEGTHKLVREGGESQTAFLTSSSLDLDLFNNRKVEVWGETFAGQKAGWLIDVGKIKVLE